jgi:aminoglycoside phosphotransferase (APT) family kinase protein
MTNIAPEKLAALLNHIAPGSQVQAAETLNLGFSNRSFRLKVIHPDASESIYVVKRYSDQDHVSGQSPAARADFEFKTLALLRHSGIPCPSPIFFDAQGTIFGTPILVTHHIPGEQILAHPANPLWAAQASTVAAFLAKIHTLPCPVELSAFLPNATTQATWFLTQKAIPDYVQAHPDGNALWHILRQELPKMKLTDQGLVHGDYWSGNMLWDAGQLRAVLDWENVAFGEPGFDIAYCRMEMIIDGMDSAAESFLKTYESIVGKPVANLGFCELAVAVQPMWQRAPYLRISPYQERFREFISNAKQRL